MQSLGRITAWSSGCLDVFWNAATRKVWIHERAPLSKYEQSESAAQEAQPEPQWHCEDDGKIVDTVARFLSVHHTEEIIFDQIMIFDEAGRHGKAADERLLLDIYDCEWSDFACENQVLHLNARCLYGVGPNKYRRLAEVLSAEKWYPGRFPDYAEIARLEAEFRAKALAEAEAESAVVITYPGTQEHSDLLRSDIATYIKRYEQRVAAGEKDWEHEFDDDDPEFGMPCPHSDNLALCEMCN